MPVKSEWSMTFLYTRHDKVGETLAFCKYGCAERDGRVRQYQATPRNGASCTGAHRLPPLIPRNPVGAGDGGRQVLLQLGVEPAG